MSQPKPFDPDDFGKKLQEGFKGMDLRSPGRRAMEDKVMPVAKKIDEALAGDEQAKEELAEKAAGILKQGEDALNNAKNLGSRILQKFRARGGGKPAP